MTALLRMCVSTAALNSVPLCHHAMASARGSDENVSGALAARPSAHPAPLSRVFSQSCIAPTLVCLLEGPRALGYEPPLRDAAAAERLAPAVAAAAGAAAATRRLLCRTRCGSRGPSCWPPACARGCKSTAAQRPGRPPCRRRHSCEIHVWAHRGVPGDQQQRGRPRATQGVSPRLWLDDVVCCRRPTPRVSCKSGAAGVQPGMVPVLGV